MNQPYRTGAVGALLDIYEQAIADLQETIRMIDDQQLVAITDAHTTDENCRSIQTILTHVVHAGFGYATSIWNHRSHYPVIRPEKAFQPNTRAYAADLDRMFQYTETVFADIRDEELEESNSSRKIHTGWGQLYDIEQLLEHAIVHVLRHRRQIEKIRRLSFE